MIFQFWNKLDGAKMPFNNQKSEISPKGPDLFTILT